MKGSDGIAENSSQSFSASINLKNPVPKEIQFFCGHKNYPLSDAIFARQPTKVYHY